MPRAIDAYPEETPDLPHFESAAVEDRVLVSNDLDQLTIAHQWLKLGVPLRASFVTWANLDERKMSVGFAASGDCGASVVPRARRRAPTREASRYPG